MRGRPALRDLAVTQSRLGEIPAGTQSLLGEDMKIQLLLGEGEGFI
ncbi:MAG: hypothetical protein PHI18_07145 [bacterium]|nr:hypothetical protein [bacterium]